MIILLLTKLFSTNASLLCNLEILACIEQPKLKGCASKEWGWTFNGGLLGPGYLGEGTLREGRLITTRGVGMTMIMIMSKA